MAKSKGLTLLEVLVVIAIIGILASILVPVVSRVGDAAMRAECASNLRQQGVALEAYVTEHNHYPLYFDRSRNAENRLWVARLFPDKARQIMKSTDDALTANQWIFECPSAQRPKVFERATAGYEHYGYNWRGVGGRAFQKSLGIGGHRGSLRNPRPPVKATEVASPAEMIAIGDGFKAWDGKVADGTGRLGRGPLPNGPNFLNQEAWDRLNGRHDGGLNMLFCDGHVEHINLHTLAKSSKDEALGIWNRDNQPHRERLNP